MKSDKIQIRNVSQRGVQIIDRHLFPPGYSSSSSFLCKHFSGRLCQKLIPWVLTYATVSTAEVIFGQLQGILKKIGSISTYLYTKLKMNALGIIKWNNSVRECHSNERPVDFQVNRNQQKTLFKQIHLIKTRKRNAAITKGYPNQQRWTVASFLDLWPAQVIKLGSGEARIWS